MSERKVEYSKLPPWERAKVNFSLTWSKLAAVSEETPGQKQFRENRERLDAIKQRLVEGVEVKT